MEQELAHQRTCLDSDLTHPSTREISHFVRYYNITLYLGFTTSQSFRDINYFFNRFYSSLFQFYHHFFRGPPSFLSFSSLWNFQLEFV